MRRGIACIAGAALLWSTIGVAGALAVPYGANPMQLAVFRSLFGFLGALTVHPFRRIRFVEWKVILLGVLFTGPLFVSYQISSLLLGVGPAAALLYLAPVIVVLASKPLLNERFTKKKILSVVMAFSGVIVMEGATDLSLRLALGLVPAFTYAGLIMFSRYLVKEKLTSLDVGAGPLPWAFLVTAVAFHRDLLSMNINILEFCIYLGIFTALLPYVLYAEGLKYVEAGRAGILSTLEPAFAVIWGALLLNQDMTFRELVGSVMIIASAAVAAADQSR